MPGAEPLPGYRLLAPLGRGGFGEVWKCEAPGGLHKAVKFVPADGERFRQELSAFEQIRAIRHPFFLGLDRVELVGGELVMVMELADCQLQDRFRVCQNQGQPGIPRGELIGYLVEAAESLDMIGTKYGLQHLDVKPENLFLVAGHAKIGDYGLVRRTERARRAKEDDNCGFTPRYTAPEVLLGRVDHRSDQYSLALVYVEMLTGIFPFSGNTAQQLMVQHLGGTPDLSRLPDEDREVVSKGLAKNPSDRFSSCTEFVKSLGQTAPITVRQQPEVESESQNQRLTTSPGSSPTLPICWPYGTPLQLEEGTSPSDEVVPAPRDESTILARPPLKPRSSVNARPVNPKRSETTTPDPFAGLQTIMPVSAFNLTGSQGATGSALSVQDFLTQLVQVACDQRDSSTSLGTSVPGMLTARFLCSLPRAMVPLKLAVVGERWGLTIEESKRNQLVLWREWNADGRKASRNDQRTPSSQPRIGLEVIVRRPTPPSAEVIVVGALRGTTDEDFARNAQADLPKIIEQIRSHLQNLTERRLRPRISTDMAIRVYPLYQDGVVGSPIGGRCQDLSLSGVRFLTPAPIRTERFYVEFQEVGLLLGQAIYVRLVRTLQDAESTGTITAGRFPTIG